MHRVVALVVPDVIIFDLAIPAEVFGRNVERGRYSFTACTEHPGAVPTASGFDVGIESGLEAIDAADTVIVPGFFPRDDPSPAVLDALRSAAGRGVRIASVCVGAFALAAAGLLDGRTATTHWEFADELARRFPAVHVTPEVLYVDEGQILTSAGIAAGVDLCLYLVGNDYGARSLPSRSDLGLRSSKSPSRSSRSRPWTPSRSRSASSASRCWPSSCGSSTRRSRPATTSTSVTGTRSRSTDR